MIIKLVIKVSNKVSKILSYLQFWLTPKCLKLYIWENIHTALSIKSENEADFFPALGREGILRNTNDYKLKINKKSVLYTHLVNAPD